MFSWHRPILGGGPTFLAGDAKYAELAGTRILLNVHRSDDPYFEWARVIEAVANGCVVVTETSTGTAPFVPGVHFVQAPLEYLAEQAVALALDEPRRAAIADAAYETLRGRLDQSRARRRRAGRGAPRGRHRARRAASRRCCPRLEDAAARLARSARAALRPSPAAHEPRPSSCASWPGR